MICGSCGQDHAVASNKNGTLKIYCPTVKRWFNVGTAGEYYDPGQDALEEMTADIDTLNEIEEYGEDE